MSNYKDIWEKGEGAKFWNTVDFNHPYYKLQEQIFRQQILRYWGLVVFNKIDKFPESVLELGAGTGRMTKILLEVFPNIKKYDIIDINPQLSFHDDRIKIYYMDLTEYSGVNLVIDGDKHYPEKYDFILASEVFMHIKPDLTDELPSKEISSVIKKYTNLLAPNGGTILNIDWTSKPEHSTWCYIHDYDKLYRENGLKCIFEVDIPEIKQKLFCYGA